MKKYYKIDKLSYNYNNRMKTIYNCIMFIINYDIEIIYLNSGIIQIDRLYCNINDLSIEGGKQVERVHFSKEFDILLIESARNFKKNKESYENIN